MSEPVPAKRGRKPDPIYGKLVELFMESGNEVAEIDWRAMGRKPDAVQHGLNAVIKRLELGAQVRVSLLDGGETLLLRRRSVGPPKPQPAVKTPQVDSGDPIPDEQYRWMVKQVIHRGFKRMGFELDEGDADPEMVKRGLERTIAELGEQSRLTVKVESPGCVAVRMKGGHKEPLRVPKKRGLDRWVKPIEGFVFSDGFDDVLFLRHAELSLDADLEKTVAAIKALDLPDFLTAEVVGDQIRVRRTRDVVVEDVLDISIQCCSLLDNFQQMPQMPGLSVEFTECDADVHAIIAGVDAEIARRGLQDELHMENRMGIPYLIRGPKPQGANAPLMRFDEEGTPLIDMDRMAQALGMGPEIECAKMLRFFIDDGGDSLCVNLSKFGMEESNLHTMLVKVIDEHFGGQVRATLDAVGGSGIWLWKPGIDPDPRWARSIVESMVAATESGEGTSADIDLADVDPRTAEEAARFLREELVRRNLDDSYTVAVVGERTVSIEST